MIPNIGHSGKHKTMETVNGSVVGMSYEWCSVGGVDEYVEHREFFRAVKILYEILMVDTCHYTCVQTNRICNAKRKPCCKWWTLVDNDVSM